MKRSYIIALLVVMFALVGASNLTVVQAKEGEKAAAKKSPKKTKKSDPFVVPKDATPTELAKYLKRLVFIRCKSKSRAKRLEFYQKKAGPTLEASEKILASSEATETELKYAARMKLWALSILSREADEEIVNAINQFPAQLTELGIKEFVERADLMRYRLEFDQALDGAPGAMSVDEVIDKIKKEAGGKTDRKSSILVRMVIGGLERNVSKEKALSLCSEFEKLYADVEGDEAAKMVRRLQGVARRMQLMGNTMEVSGTLLDGETFDWSKYKGKVVLVQFWATWCAPCRAEIPNIKKHYELYRDRGFEVVGISLDSDREKLEKFVEDKELPWPTIFENGKENTGWDAPMALDYAVSGIPTLILVNQEGKVVCERARGPKLAKELEKLLGPPEEPEEKTSEKADDIDTVKENH